LSWVLLGLGRMADCFSIGLNVTRVSMVKSFILLCCIVPKIKKLIFSYHPLVLIALYCVGTIHRFWDLAMREGVMISLGAVCLGLLPLP
jgi:hypothetical protein